MAKEEVFQFTIEAGRAEHHYWMDLWRYRVVSLLCIFGRYTLEKQKKPLRM